MPEQKSRRSVTRRTFLQITGAATFAVLGALTTYSLLGTGDYVWHEVEAIFELVPSLSHLNAKYGVYIGLGNHDHWTDVELASRAIEREGLPLLVNQGVPISVGKSTLYLASLDDGWSGKLGLAGVMADRRSTT